MTCTIYILAPFELLELNCTALSYEEILSDIFPQYIIETNFGKCVMTVKALHNMVQDNYDRDELPRNLCINKQGMDMYDYLNNVNSYLDFMFQDLDFLHLEEMCSLYKKNPKILEEFLHIDIEQYIELMPMDIQEEYNMQTERKNGI